jgi:hypothetical protein
MFKDKINQSVAEAAAKIMMGEKALHPNQQKLDVHEPEKDELTADDFKKLRAKKEVKQEEVEQVDEVKKESKKDFDERQKRLAAASNETAKDPKRLGRLSKIPGYTAAMNLAKKTTKEEVEDLLEYETNKDGKYVHNAKTGRYGGSEKPTDPFAGVRGPSTAALSAIEKEKQKKKKKFSEMVDVYNTTGIKGLFEELQIAKEEASQEEFNAELEKQKKKASGTAAELDKAKVAKPAVQAVQQEEIQVINADIANGVDTVNIAERELSGGEMKKKEEIVKSMKKGIEGFKSRYGKDAKSVMYATATKQAKGE